MNESRVAPEEADKAMEMIDDLHALVLDFDVRAPEAFTSVREGGMEGSVLWFLNRALETAVSQFGMSAEETMRVLEAMDDGSVMEEAVESLEEGL